MTRPPATVAMLVMAAALVLGTAGASADDAPVITISEPGSGALLTAPEVTVRGEARMIDVNRVSAVTVRVRSAGGDLSRPDCWAPDPTVLTGAKATFSCTFGLSHNGPHSVIVRATGDEIVDLNGPESREATRVFKVEVAPAPPRDVRVEVGPDRRVTISWARNTEPDLRGYQVSRLGPGSPSGIVVASVPQPPSGDRVSAVDGSVPPAGGAYEYVVTAMRPDGDGKLTPNRAIARSSPGRVQVAAGPTPGGGLPGPGVAAPGGRGGGGVSSILSPGGGVPTSLALPEGAALPLDDGSSSADAFSLPGGEGSESAESALDDSRSASNQRALFIPLAAGLLLCVLAFHLRQFSRTVLDAPAAYHPLLEPESGGGRRDREPPTAVLVGANRPGRADPHSPE